MIRITDTISIDEDGIKEEFVRASGPGGQHVNKVSTAVQLRFGIKDSGLPEDVKRRLFNLAGGKVTVDGVLIISARQFRSREQNRKDALDKLITLVRRAAEKPRARIKTRATLSSKKRRLDSKRTHARVKSMRKTVKGDD